MSNGCSFCLFCIYSPRDFKILVKPNKGLWNLQLYFPGFLWELTLSILHLFLLFLSLADAKFATIAQIDLDKVDKLLLWWKILMTRMCLKPASCELIPKSRMRLKPASWECLTISRLTIFFKKCFSEEIKPVISAELESDQKTTAAINFK